jgi:hypothetical protein
VQVLDGDSLRTALLLDVPLLCGDLIDCVHTLLTRFRTRSRSTVTGKI